MSDSNSEEQGTFSQIISNIPDETLGMLVRNLTELKDLQDTGRVFIQRFLQRNAIFTAKVQADNRITIPSAEVEKLDLEKGDLVQVVSTPIEELPEDVSEESEQSSSDS